MIIFSLLKPVASESWSKSNVSCGLYTLWVKKKLDPFLFQH